MREPARSCAGSCLEMLLCIVCNAVFVLDGFSGYLLSELAL